MEGYRCQEAGTEDLNLEVLVSDKQKAVRAPRLHQVQKRAEPGHKQSLITVEQEGTKSRVASKSGTSRGW